MQISIWQKPSIMGQGKVTDRLQPYTSQFFTKRQILDWSKLKALAEDKIKVIEKMNYGLGRVVVTSIFSFSQNVFKSFLSQGPKMSGLYGKILMKKNFENIWGIEETARQ